MTTEEQSRTHRAPAKDLPWHLECVESGERYAPDQVRYRSDSGGVLDVVHDFTRGRRRPSQELFDRRLGSRVPEDRSGVWRFRELVLPLTKEVLVTRQEGGTHLYDAPGLASWVGLDSLLLKHEGENPTGSFKDRGMTVAISLARSLGMESVACASTGNTSASMAAYAAQAGMAAYVFIPEGKIAYGKLSQALAYGAKTVQIAGDFDAAMALVQEVCEKEGIYLVNSVNPYRIEGQKAIGFEILQDLGWTVPDWIVVPGGNLGNSSAIAKGMSELKALGLIDRLPRIGVIQAAGANPLARAVREERPIEPLVGAETLATAIRIGNPVSWRKSLRGVRESGGAVTDVTDQEILDAKAKVDRAGIGAEPASCAAVAGIKRLVAEGVIEPTARVCAVLTGHLLKDPDVTVGYHRGELDGIEPRYANAPVSASADLKSVLAAMKGES